MCVHVHRLNWQGVEKYVLPENKKLWGSFRAFAAWMLATFICGLPFSYLHAEIVFDPFPDPIAKGQITVELALIADGFSSPVLLTFAPDDPLQRRFIVDQSGRVSIVHEDRLLGTPFLDVSTRIIAADERGLLGLAFHPDYHNAGATGEGKLYTYTSEVRSGSADFTILPVGSIVSHHSVVTEWSVSVDPNVVDESHRREVMRVDQPSTNHNGGMIEFGPDGYLYIAFGDGGHGHDIGNGHPPEGNGQSLQTITGSIARIDPLDPNTTPGSPDPNSANGKYRVPLANPFVDQAGIDEIYAYGFRNPYRFSFDSLTGQLIVADVGQWQIEEVNIVGKGGNYGWNLKEGSFKAVTGNGVETDLSGLPPGLIDPNLEYDHSEGTSVIGGYVYRGEAVAELSGLYLFSDYRLLATGQGRLFYGNLATGEIKEMRIGADDRSLGFRATGMGQDAAGELYVLGADFVSGQVFKVVPLVCDPVPVGDLNGDCFAGLHDVRLLAESWLLNCALNPLHPVCELASGETHVNWKHFSVLAEAFLLN
jgi:glucose/arabinose dehydrogenase